MEGLLRIAFLDSWRPASFDGSGTSVGIRNLATGLTRLGHQVHMVRPRGRDLGLLRRVAFNLALPSRLRAKTPFDLVVGFDIDGFRWAPSRTPDLPYVVSLKGIAADEARFSRSIGERLALSTLGRIEGRNARGADRVLVPSRYSAEVATRMYGVPVDRIGVVPEAVDLAPWRSIRGAPGTARGAASAPEWDSLEPTPRPLTILSVARQYPRKDTATLLRAMPSVLARHSGTRLRVIGGGPEIPRLRGLVRDLRLGASVALEGAVESDAQVREAFFDADVFCLPSLQEGFGIVFVEAMAAGLPIVAARAGAVPEVVEDEVTGLLVPPGDPPALGAALIRLLDDADLRRRQGDEGTRRAESFDLEKVARCFLDEVRIRAHPES
jgi:glycosyltransferase involved in cell wall biosynthesis